MERKAEGEKNKQAEQKEKRRKTTNTSLYNANTYIFLYWSRR